MSKFKVLWKPQPGKQTDFGSRREDFALFGGSKGPGKLQRVSDRVCTPLGWKRLGDVRIGDTVSDPTTGGGTKIIGVYPQGVQDIYKVTCDDGAITYAGLDHLWSYRTVGNIRPRTKPSSERQYAIDNLGTKSLETRWNKYRIGRTGDLISVITDGKSPRIPLTEPVIFTVNGRTGHGELDPYMLGVLLGDGSIHNLVVTACENEIRGYLSSHEFVPSGNRLHTDGLAIHWTPKGRTRKLLRAWVNNHGLSKKRSWEKFIPPYVFTSSLDYRRNFICGLMDTDGSVDDEGSCYYYTTSRKMADGFISLIRSIGGKAYVREKNTHYLKDGVRQVCRMCYVIRVVAYRKSSLFRLPRKSSKCYDGWNNGNEITRAIISIEKVSNEETLCIKVDSPYGLYITDDFIVTHNSDCLIAEALRQIEKKNYHALLIRRTFPQLQELIDRAHQLYPKLGGKWSGTEHRFTFNSGAYIEFGHCAHEIDKERYQGREFGFIGFDQLEQFTESQFNFIVAQNRSSDADIDCYARATANPGSIGHWWIKRRFIDSKTPGKTYTDEYILPDKKKVTRTYCYIKATIYDNPILLKANPTYLANLMSLPDIERRAYLEGDWNAFTTSCVFDSNGMQRLEGKIKDPKWVGYLRASRENYQIIDDSNGNLKVWKTPETEMEYMVSVDVAEGDVEGDFSSVEVVDKSTWEQVAEWHGHCTPFELADIVYDLGYYYNEAEVAIEKPGPGLSTIEKIKEKGYSNLFYYETGKAGFLNNVQTRTNMIATLMDVVKDGSAVVRSRELLDEMYNFIRNEKTMKIGAREGCNDDLVMGFGIGCQCIRINPYREPIKKGYRRSEAVVVQSIIGGRSRRRSRQLRAA